MRFLDTSVMTTSLFALAMAIRTLIAGAELAAALKKNKKASATFEGFSYSHKKEYVDWITEAKREETKSQRLATTVAWLTEGKPRHWKYANC